MSSFSDIIEDSLCVGQRTPDQEEHVLLFVQMLPGVRLTKRIREQIRQHISRSLSPRHAPKHVISVPKIPYNGNGKKLEVLVKRVLSSGVIDARTRGTLVDEDSLDFFVDFATNGGYLRLEEAKL